MGTIMTMSIISISKGASKQVGRVFDLGKDISVHLRRIYIIQYRSLG